MNVKLKVLSAAVLFFMGADLAFGQKTDTAKTKDIEEVVVLGYVKRKATEVTGSSVQLKSDKVNTPAVISVDQVLQGQSPGVQVNTSSGTPGSVQDIRVRGVGSLTASNSPLIVIDGVPVVNNDVTPLRGGLGSEATTSSSLSSLAAINSQDIESVTVLKDASATAAYGARGSNGVIVITTKRGKRGKTQFSLNTSTAFQSDAYVKRHPLTGAQKKELLAEALFNQYGATQGFTKENAIAWAAQDATMKSRIGGVQYWDGTEYDWPGLLSRPNALAQTYDLSASGGADKSTFYASLGYNKTEPTVIGSPFERMTGMFRFTRSLTDRLDFETSVNGSWMKQNPLLEKGGYFSNPFVTRVLMSPWVNPYNADGTLNIVDIADYTSLHNSLYTLTNNVTWNKLVRGISNTKLDYKILKNLTFGTRLSLDYMVADSKDYKNRYHGDGDGTKGASERTMATDFTFVNQNSLNYNFKIDKHRFDLTGIYEYQKNQYDYLYGYGENFPADGLTNIASAGANKDAISSFLDWYNISYLGMFNYSFADKFIVDATLRREGASRFAKGHRFGTFWSIGGAYNLHKDLLKGVFDEFKLRASYGLTGNSGVDLNTYQSLLSYDADYDGNGAAYPSTFGNENLTWEKNKTFDAGVDFGLFDRRLTGSFAYFNKYTFDLLQSVPLSRTTGFTSQNQNVGALRNTGIEAMLSYDVIRTDDFKWNLSANIATLKNKVEKLALDGNGNPINPSGTSSYKNTEIGQAVGYWYMPTWAGVNVDTGAPEWFVNGVDGDRTSDYTKAARYNQGIAIPKYTGGFSTAVSYKNVFLNAMMYFAGGHKLYEQYAQWYMRTNNFALVNYNGADDLMNRWQKPGDVTNVPKLSYNQNNNFYNTSSRHLYDGTFMRLKDITIGYNLPTEYVNSIGLTGLTLSLKGSNLWTWVKDKGLKLDPETSAAGYTTLTTPPVKSVMFTANLKF